jgi:hypothetical protein
MKNEDYFVMGVCLIIVMSDIKFMTGLAAGIYVSSKYDFNPYIMLVENKIKSIINHK